MVEVGISEMKTIQSAAIENPEVLKNANIREIAIGKITDSIAVNSDPTNDIKTLENVIFIVKNDVIYKD